ncbi:hypothetical protein C8J56DRAFT_1168333 [Mycena floridula]|nr:hypothetical protein C8J56DRAFT_1168333 [Mycena floridula]
MPGAVHKAELAAIGAKMTKAYHCVQAVVLFLEIVTLFVGRTEHPTLFRWVGYAALCFQYRAYISICIDILLFSGYMIATIVRAIRVFAEMNVSILWVPHFLVSVVLPKGVPEDMRSRMFIDGFWVLNVALFHSNPDLPLLDGSLQQFSRLVTTTLRLSLIFLAVYMLGGLVILASLLKQEKAEGAAGGMATDRIKANNGTRVGKVVDLEVLENGVAPLDV